MWILVEWTEEKLFSIISFKSIEMPRRDYKDYKENDSVQAKFGGKVYPAWIIQKSCELDADDAPDYMTDRTARPYTDTKRSDSIKIQEVEEEVHCLRKKLRKLEDRMVQLEQALKDSMGPEKPLTEMEQLKLDNFLSDNEHNILKFLAMKVFTKEDLTDRSLSGKKSAKSVETARLPLDQEKLNMLEQLFKYRCPSTTRKMFVEKLQNIQKVIRRESKK